jgi:Adaptin N terminal region
MPQIRCQWEAEARDDLSLVGDIYALLKFPWLNTSSNGIRNDLQHPNEYIRGNTLRFLCKLRESELIEPLLSSARSCLEHRHAYVRKNAVFAVASIFQHSESLIPDAPELIATFLETESDHTCKRNAFAALVSISHDKALAYLSSVFDGIPNADELLQLVELEFIRKDAVQNSQNKVWCYWRFMKTRLTDSGPLSTIDLRPSRSWCNDCGL